MAKKDEKKGEITNEHDKFIKVAFGITETMADYLNNFMSPELLDDLDISTLERVEESSITEELSEFFADMIWKLKFKNGTDLEIGILIEHKSWRPLYPHFQPLEYMIGRWRNKRKAEGKPELLVPFLIYHGTETWETKKMESYFGNVPGSFLRFLPSFDILFTHITNLPDALILACASSFLRRTFLTLKHSHDKEYLREHFAELLFLDFSGAKDENSVFFFKAHFVYLSATSKISKEGIKKQLKKIDMGHKSNQRELYAHEIIELEAKEEGRQEGRQEGRLAGIEEGLQKERKKNALRLWQNGLDLSMIANVTDLSIEEIKQLIAEFQK